MDLIFLGTSGATPTKDRNLPAVALRLDSGKLLLFDAGEDVQRQFERANLKFNVPTSIFISHLHGDHVIGLPGLLFNFHLNSRTKALTVYGPAGLAPWLMAHYQIVGLKATNYNLTVVEIVPPPPTAAAAGPGECQRITYTHFLTPSYGRHVEDLKSNVLEQRAEYSVKFAWALHSVPTMAFRLEESPLDGKFAPARARAMHIPMGPLWKRMQKGGSVTLKDGTVVDPLAAGIVTAPRPGRIIAYSGDTARCAGLLEIAAKADLLICESTYGEEHRELAAEKKHLTAGQAAQIAAEAGVTTLYLTHFSSRYKDTSPLLAEARATFSESYAAEDLLAVEIKPPVV